MANVQTQVLESSCLTGLRSSGSSPLPVLGARLMAGKLGLNLPQWLPHLDAYTALAGFLTLANSLWKDALSDFCGLAKKQKSRET